MAEDDKRHPDIVRIDKHVDQLMAHYTHVHVFASRYDESTGNTHYFNVGQGNFLTRYGQMKSYILREEELMRQGDSQKES